eukprot:TRINITY_DN7405_c0_g1_i1.p1 TRINITY_DN7405_c0_g1~~TRINITY_DN7405_c0_g1_i1.p1  ORF type:complete len:646 (+),score=124.94 TRINITY_DN7405_c0_g1_i1:43-1980(+)
MSFDRKIKDREISSDLNRLEEDVSMLQRNARRGYDSGPSSWQSDRGLPSTSDESAVDVMKRKYQDDFCRMKDQHFEEKKVLKENISQLETELHNLKKEHHIVKSEYLVLSHTRGSGSEASDIKKNRTIQKLGAQLQESENQVLALQGSLVEAIEAIRKQYGENKMLVRQLEKRGVTVTGTGPPVRLPTTAEGDTNQVLDIMSDQNRRLASELENAENTVRDLGVLVGREKDDDYVVILQTLRQRLSQPDPSTVIKNLENQLQELRLDPVADALSDEKKTLLFRLDGSEKQLQEANQLRLLNEGEISRQASQIEELKSQIENFKISTRKSDDKIRDLTSRIEGMAIAEAHKVDNKSNPGDIEQLTGEIAVLSEQKMEALDAIRALTQEVADIKQSKDSEINELKSTQSNLQQRLSKLDISNKNTEILENRVRDLELLVANKAQIISDLEGQLSQQASKANLQQELDSLTITHKNIQDELLSCKASSDDKIKSLQLQHESDLMRIKQQLSGKDNECAQIQRQLQESEKELATIQLQKEVLARKVARQDDLEEELNRLRVEKETKSAPTPTPTPNSTSDSQLVTSLRNELSALTITNASLVEANVQVSTLYKQRLSQILVLSNLHKESVSDLEGKVCLSPFFTSKPSN